MKNKQPSGSEEPDRITDTDQKEAAVPRSFSSDTLENDSTQEEPSNREIVNMLQAMKIDVDGIGNVLQSYLMVDTHTEGNHALNTPSKNKVELMSPSRLIRITEEWDDANPKGSPSPPPPSGQAVILQMPNESGLKHHSATRINTRAIVISSSPKVSKTKYHTNSLPDGNSTLRARLLAQSGAKLIAKRTGTITHEARVPMNLAMNSIDAFFSGTTDRSLMLLYQRIREERHRRLTEATVAGSQDRIRILNSIKDRNKSLSENKKKSKM